MIKKKYRYVLHDVDSDEIMRDTTDADEMVDCLSGLLDGDRDVLYKIRIHNNGKIVKSLDNMTINGEIIKKMNL